MKAYNTNFNMSLISTIYNKIYTWVQEMIEKKKKSIVKSILGFYVFTGGGGDKARAFKNALQSLQYSLKSLQMKFNVQVLSNHYQDGYTFPFSLSKRINFLFSQMKPTKDFRTWTSFYCHKCCFMYISAHKLLYNIRITSHFYFTTHSHCFVFYFQINY